MASRHFPKSHYRVVHPDSWDFNNLFSVWLDFWDMTFSKNFESQHTKTLMHSLKKIRNEIAHQYTFTARDTYRAIDSMQMFLEQIGAPIEDINIERLKALERLYNFEKE